VGAYGLWLNPTNADLRAFTGELERPSRIVPEPNSILIVSLDPLAQSENVRRVDMEGYTDISIGGVIVLANTLPTKYVVVHDFIPSFSGLEDLRDLSRRFSHVVVAVSPTVKGVPQSLQERISALRQRGEANYHREAEILSLYASGSLEDYGFQFSDNVVGGESEP